MREQYLSIHEAMIERFEEMDVRYLPTQPKGILYVLIGKPFGLLEQRWPFVLSFKENVLKLFGKVMWTSCRQVWTPVDDSLGGIW